METTKNILSFLTFAQPTKEQVNALNAMEKFIANESKADFLVLSGAAGTGKSSITTALVGFLNHLDINYHICAPTGRAARIIGRKSAAWATTIHSLIYKPTTNIETGEVTFNLKINDDNEKMVFIIDEASMIGTTNSTDENSLFKCKNGLLQDLVMFIKGGNTENKIIFLGDRNQLTPINEEKSQALDLEYLKNQLNLKGDIFLLTEVKRQKEDSPIMENAIRTRIAIDENQLSVKLKGDGFGSLSAAANNFAIEFKKSNPESIIAISPYHNGNKIFNEIVRSKIFGENRKPIQAGDWMLITQSWKRNNSILYSGDHVLIKEINLTETTIEAGMYFAPIKFTAKDLEGNDIEIADWICLTSLNFPTGWTTIEAEAKLRKIRYTKNPKLRDSKNISEDRYLGAVRMTNGYAITCHKAQGGEWDKVYMSTFRPPSLRYQYTAVTRAINKLFLF